MNPNVKSPCDKHGDFFMTRYLISLISALAVLVFLTNNGGKRPMIFKF